MPKLYGELKEDDVTARGFELVESDTELWDEDNVEEDGTSTGEEDPNDLSRPSWEVSLFPFPLTLHCSISGCSAISEFLKCAHLVLVFELLKRNRVI